MPDRTTNRPARLLSLALAAALALTGGAALAVAPAPTAHAALTVSGLSAPEIQRLIFDEVNAQRKKAGVAQLTMNSTMNSVATAWSGKQASTKKMAHNPSYSAQIPKGWRAAAENVAAGYTPKAVVAAWMNSAGHKKNILNSSYTHIGIGVGVDSSGRAYYTQNFGAYASVPAGTNTKPTGSDPCAVPSGIPSASGTYVVAATPITARTAPSTGCAKGASQIVYGTPLTRTGTYGGFTRVKSGSATWWVKDSDIKAAAARYLSTALPLRASASSSAAAVAQLPAFTKVVMVATSGSWRKVVASGKTGWVPTANLVVGAKTTAKVNMRGSAATNGKVVQVLSKGAAVGPVRKSSGAWRQVSYNGKTGWVHKDYLKQ